MTQWALSFLIALLFLGCTGQKGPLESEDPNTIYMAIGTKPNTLDPRLSTGAVGMRVTELIFQSLVKLGPDLKVIGDAAQSWSYKNLKYRFLIKKDLKFSNGRKVTPEDLRFTFEQFMSPKSPFSSAFKSIQKIDVVHTKLGIQLDIYLSKYSATFLTSDLPVIKLLPKKESIELGEEFHNKPLGSGPYKVNTVDENQISLTKSDFNPLGQTAHIKLKIIRDDFTRYQKMLRGNIDLILSDVPPSKVKDFERKSDRFKVYKYPGLTTSYMLLNLKIEALKNKSVRKAIAQAIKREDLIKYKMEGLGQEATAIITPASPYYNAKLKPIPYDLEAAKNTIKDLNLPELTIKTSNSQEAVDNARVMAYQLREAGFKIKIQSYEWGTFYGDIKKGKFQLATMRWVGVFDPDIYRLSLHSKLTPPGRNRGYFSHSEFDRLVEKGPSIENFQQRIKHYERVQEIVMEELPIIPLWHNQQVTVTNKRVKNYKPWINGSFSSLLSVTK